ncbi:LTA synthase family protein [Sinanaerobacter chloroacetimidivorans]|uniref:Sulfatase-like hydrolase/transferase n=1 Tax=Sinanaerobacter chloroacetimidivorans TaxID=2818044 RepID=A0A8J7W023_9FIRM|nr:alkaline phosphatase family protein [Sinanaerobacter chloroacetimidivorans]MBR0598317.1 sulfatase-like hydrolase/transferase [Sinanaerobacter chloroacetimidivorans]
MKSFFEKYLHNSISLCVLLAFLINFIIESVSRRSALLGLDFLLDSPMTFFYNAFIIFATLSIAFIVKRRIFVYIMVSIFWLAIGITNGVILGFRTTPFTVTDLTLLESVMSIIPNYLTTTQMILAGAAAVIIIIALVLVFIFMPKHKQKISYKKSLLGLIVLAVSMVGITNLAISRNWVSTYFDNLNYAYNDYGFPYCFINTWLNTGISAPRGYSNKEILSIFTPEELADLTSVPTSTSGDKKTPNVLMLQLESFFDPTQLKEVTYSEEPVPNFEKLKENYSTGYLTVPVLGAGTANTEFEVLSGMRVRFFGPGEYPYKSVLRDESCETIGYDLKRLGYSTHAIHNHRGAFYGRNKVFSNLGFDTFTSLEYMNNVIKTPKNWAKDGVLTGEILSALQSTENRDFVYTISVQGHGQYPTGKVLENPDVIATGLREGIDANAFQYYLQQVHEMDIFIGELTDALEDFDEDTVLVMYGDHLPSLNLMSSDLVNNTVYQTQYVIWDNFGMKKEDKDLFSYQLSAEVLSRLGIHDGVLTKYHQNHKEDPNYLTNLKALQYDMLYGNNYIFGETNPFASTDLKMGVKDIKVEKVVEIGSKYYIKGQNFTPFSKISIDDKVLDTIFLGPTILGLLEEVDPDQVVNMKVSQVEKNNEILSTTE